MGPLCGVDVELVDYTTVSIPVIVSTHLGASVSVPVAGHHPSTIPFWAGYNSSAIRGCVRTVEPSDPAHKRLATVDYKACYLSCMEQMGQDIPVPCEDDTFCPFTHCLAQRSSSAQTRGMWCTWRLLARPSWGTRALYSPISCANFCASTRRGGCVFCTSCAVPVRCPWL